jgi:hypothetical protein
MQIVNAMNASFKSEEIYSVGKASSTGDGRTKEVDSARIQKGIEFGAGSEPALPFGVEAGRSQVISDGNLGESSVLAAGIELYFEDRRVR